MEQAMDIEQGGVEQQPGSSPPKRLYRSSDQKLFLGVAGGVAEYFDLDPTLVRILFVVATFLGLSGVAIYIVLAIVMPDEDSLDLEPRVAARRTLDQAGREIERGVNLATDKVRTIVGNRRGQQPATTGMPVPPPPSADQPTTRVDVDPVRDPVVGGTSPAVPHDEPGN
jgi:phage shock protein PspC (stress-responsive transcriptional regulator)